MTQDQETHATWALRLWLDNDEGLYSTFRYEAQEIKNQYATRNERIQALAEVIREDFENSVVTLCKSNVADSWAGAIQDIVLGAEIDYERIADLFAGELFNDEEDDE